MNQSSDCQISSYLLSPVRHNACQFGKVTGFFAIPLGLHRVLFQIAVLVFVPCYPPSFLPLSISNEIYNRRLTGPVPEVTIASCYPAEFLPGLHHIEVRGWISYETDCQLHSDIILNFAIAHIITYSYTKQALANN